LYDAINANINVSIFFLSASWISAPYIEVPSKMPRELLWKPEQGTRV
jgi:hypothetical protein